MSDPARRTAARSFSRTARAAVAAGVCPAQQFVLRGCRRRNARRAPRPAVSRTSTCDPDVPMRRPLSIMRVDRARRLDRDPLQDRRPGPAQPCRSSASATPISVLGPIGQGFTAHVERPRALLIGGGVGIPPMVFLAESLRPAPMRRWQPLVLMGSEIAVPVSRAALDDHGAGHAARGDRLHAAARWTGACRAGSRRKAGFAGLLRRLRHRPRRALAGLAGREGAGRSRSLRLRPDADAAGDGPRRARIRRALPGLARGIHGLRRRRLRRVARCRSCSADGPPR